MIQLNIPKDHVLHRETLARRVGPSAIETLAEVGSH